MLKIVVFKLKFTSSFQKTSKNKFDVPSQQKDWNSSYQVRQILAPFCNLFARNLGLNCVKGLRVTKIFKQIKFEVVWGKLAAKLCFQRQSSKKHLRETLMFMWNSTLQQKFISYISVVFGYYWKKKSYFGPETRH